MTPEHWLNLKNRLAKSKFRSRFKLGETELRLLAENGFEIMELQCRNFIEKRLAPAQPPHDGKQTPMRGHPCFIAQHATGCCCRKCLWKWHGIPAGHALTEAQIGEIVQILMLWIRDHSEGMEKFPHTPELFS